MWQSPNDTYKTFIPHGLNFFISICVCTAAHTCLERGYLQYVQCGYLGAMARKNYPLFSISFTFQNRTLQKKLPENLGSQEIITLTLYMLRKEQEYFFLPETFPVKTRFKGRCSVHLKLVLLSNIYYSINFAAIQEHDDSKSIKMLSSITAMNWKTLSL